MKRILVIIILFFFVHGSRGQSQLPLHDMPDDTAKVSRLLTITDQYITRDPDSALLFSKQALGLSRKLSYKKGEGRALLKSGIIYNDLGDYSKATDVLLESVRISSGINDKRTESKAYNNLGNCYALQDNEAKALEYYDLSLNISHELNDKASEATTLNNMGNIYYYTEKVQKQFDFLKTLDHYTRALEVQEARNDTDGIVTTLDNIALVYIDQEKYPEALAMLNRALDLAQRSNNRNDVIHCLSNLGMLYGNMGDHYRSIYYHDQTLQLSREMRNASMQMYSYGYLAEQFSVLGNHAQAYAYQKKYSEIKDTLLSAETSSRVAELQSRYENEKREKEFALLKQKGELLEKEKAISKLEADRNWTIALASIGGFVLVLAVALLVYSRYKIKHRAAAQLEKQNAIISQKNKDITDSINYARRLQRSVIASDQYLQQHLPSHFVLYRPKDIVSGDFYWAHSPARGEVIMAVADCTGHGVPGAFMSVLGASLLNEIVTERKIHHPNLVLNLLRDNIIKVLNPQGSPEETNDGMDIVMCRFNFEKQLLSFSAANNVLWIARGNDMLELQGDRFPVGKHSGVLKPFSMKNVQLQKDDVIYIFTDGFADQFGGPNGKKFKYKELQKLLLSVKDQPLEAQRTSLEKTFDNWKRDLEQVDDVTLVGIRI